MSGIYFCVSHSFTNSSVTSFTSHILLLSFHITLVFSEAQGLPNLQLSHIREIMQELGNLLIGYINVFFVDV